MLLYSLETGRLHDTVTADATVTGDHRSQQSLWAQRRNLGIGNLLWLDEVFQKSATLTLVLP